MAVIAQEVEAEEMKSLRFVSLIAVFALFLPVFAIAKEKDEGKLQLTDSVRIGTTQLEPGDYKVEWNGAGTMVKVNFLENHETVATSTGKIIDLKKPATEDEYVLRPVKNGKAKTIEEIDFANRTQALRIEPQTFAKPSPVQKR
jgi:hypothetical protein